MFKVNNANTKTMCEICSKLTIRTPKNVNDVVVLVSVLLTLNRSQTLLPAFSLMNLNKCRLGSSWINTRSKLGMLQLRRIQFVVSLQLFKHRTQTRMYCCGIFQNFRDNYFWHSFSTADLESKQFRVGENECGYLLHSRRQII